jgi:hypothetical protein
MKHICVYAGANSGTHPAYALAASQLGALLAEYRLTVVFGGGNIGLMRVLADAVLLGKGNMIGVIPGIFVERGLRHTGVQDTRIVATMHQRKAMMADLADGFIALPGGLGTIEELMEILTWAQIGLHAKPVGLLNIDGFYGPLLGFIEQLTAQGFLKPIRADWLLVDSSPAALLTQMLAFQAQATTTFAPG